jgi:hypothetical protein
MLRLETIKNDLKSSQNVKTTNLILCLFFLKPLRRRMTI